MRLTHADLAAVADLARARSILAAYAPPTAIQRRTRDEMLAFIAAHPTDAHLRSCVEGHLTASALLIDAAGERALLTFHKKLGLWLQLGGHCDGDANLPHVALREACEESGIERISIDPVPIDVDIHRIPPHKHDPAHLHLDTRFVVFAEPGARAVVSDESLELRWFTREEVRGLDTDDSVRRLFPVAFARVNVS